MKRTLKINNQSILEDVNFAVEKVGASVKFEDCMTKKAIITFREKNKWKIL